MPIESRFPSRTKVKYMRIGKLVELAIAGKIDLRPLYQRPIRWKKVKMNAFMGVICENGYVQCILLYTFKDGDVRQDELHIFECMDGQHRIFVLKHFMTSTPVALPGSAPFMITWERKNDKGEVTNIFYEENAHTRAWIRKYPAKRFEYMTAEERDTLSNMRIKVEKTLDPLTYNQRRCTFLSIQEGVPVRGSDYLKNCIHLGIIREINEMAFESTYKNNFLKHLTTNPERYWVHWAVRMYFIMFPSEGKAVLDAFLYTDSEITRLAKDDNPMFEIDDSKATVFRAAVSRFAAFLDSLPSVKLAPCMYFALFAFLKDAPIGTEDMLWSWMPGWCDANENQSKVWETKKTGGTPEARIEFFNSNLEELKGYAEAEFEEKAARKKLSKKIRKELYARDCGDISTPGTCFCCKEVIRYGDNYEAGHILAQSKGGADTLDNLRALCKTCNCRMGTMHMMEYCNKFYLHLHPI